MVEGKYVVMKVSKTRVYTISVDTEGRSIFLLLLLLLCYNQTKHILQNLHDNFVIYILRTTD